MTPTQLLYFAPVVVGLFCTWLSARYQRRHGDYGYRGYTVSWKRMAGLTVVLALMGGLFYASDVYVAAVARQADRTSSATG